MMQTPTMLLWQHQKFSVSFIETSGKHIREMYTPFVKLGFAGVYLFFFLFFSFSFFFFFFLLQKERLLVKIVVHKFIVKLNILLVLSIFSIAVLYTRTFLSLQSSEFKIPQF